LTHLDDHSPQPPDQIHAYLAELGQELCATPEETEEILREVHSHLELALWEAAPNGDDETRHLARILDRFGTAKQIGQQLRRIHGRATWTEAGLTALPTLLVPALSVAIPRAFASFVALPLLLAACLSALFGYNRHLRWPLWWWAWLGWLPCLILGMWNEPIWVIASYVVLLALVFRRDWLEATLAIYPLPTFCALQYLVLPSREIRAAGWSGSSLTVLGVSMSLAWAALLVYILRSAPGRARIIRAIKGQGITVLLNALTILAARLWPTHPFPYPFTSNHFVRVTLPYTLFHGPPLLLFSLVTILPALLALMQSQARQRPPSRPVRSG
jgi:hypothetical protein